MFKSRETIIFLILTAAITALSFLQLNKLNILYSILEALFYFIFFCTIIYTVIILLKNKKSLPLLQRGKPLLLGICLAVFLHLLSFLIRTDGGKKTLIAANNYGDVFAVSCIFFSDNTFRLLNSGPFSGQFYRGTYTLHKDTLILANDSLKYLYPKLTLVLKEHADKRKYFEYIDTSFYSYTLFITEDNRH